MILPFQFNINLVEVKGPEKPQDLPKKKKTWSLRELRSVDGKWSQQNQSDFRFTHTKVNMFLQFNFQKLFVAKVSIKIN